MEEVTSTVLKMIATKPIPPNMLITVSVSMLSTMCLLYLLKSEKSATPQKSSSTLASVKEPQLCSLVLLTLWQQECITATSKKCMPLPQSSSYHSRQILWCGLLKKYRKRSMKYSDLKTWSNCRTLTVSMTNLEQLMQRRFVKSPLLFVCFPR